MPRRAKGPRLYLDPKRKQWIIRDGLRFIRTGCGERDGAEAEKYLAQYIGQKHKPEASGAPMIAGMLAVYGNEVAPNMKSARLIAYHISNLLKWWGDKTAAQITMRNCKEFCSARPSQAAIADLKTLKAAADYWHKSEYGPLNFQPVFWRPKANPPKERWLTRQEAARLVKAAKPYLHLRRAILLGLHTGSRPGVILALRWDQIDLKTGVMRRLQSGALQDAKKRAPPVRLGRKILGHLRRWKRLDGETEYVCHFEGRAVDDPHASWRKVIKAAGLPGITRHTLRHTRATWMAQNGVSLFEAAGFLGMTTKTLESVYAHHHPDWQERAANI
jgi:integrase